MRARVVVFPMKGRKWCFSRSIENPVNSESNSAHSNPSTLIDLCKTISSNAKPMAANAELVVDFVSNKMNKAWIGLEKAPEGSFKNKIYGVGLWLLARVKPSEIFLQSISKDITRLEITYPTSLNARLVRRRLRHIAMRGLIIHKNYMYGSASLLPLTAALVVLPLPNIPFFWMLFRTYSHWRALQGSEKLLQIVSDGSATQNANTNTEHGNSQHGSTEITRPPWVLAPSKELEELLCRANAHDGLSKCVVLDICKTFNLNSNDVFKYERSV
ncbi:hypothetical protein Nepgr_019397 [Nepenthes gracilis]|uniref:Uncharacterized protein n=1 Tax=Nepenthes gracilis TaxID=150966 RepID=A0AAD3SX21_NEPGR|nr:hypothetical protein Nepgr_019397 [Nepenthes gracilis]